MKKYWPHLIKALDLGPCDAEAWKNRRIALLNLGRPIDGLASFEKALEIRPEYADAIQDRDIASEQKNKKS